MIKMWKGTTAPKGLAICDGSGGTPDLREKFIRGANTLVPIGSTGGANQVTLSIDMIPDHTHGGVATQGSGGTEGVSGYNVAAFTGSTIGISNPGYTGGVPVPTLPPFYALAYIIKTA
jgi:microcystin-dependent protein